MTWAPIIESNDWEIDWNAPAIEVEAFVRAALPDPGAYTGLGHELMVILNARAVDAAQFQTLPVGTPYVMHGHLHIRCGEGVYNCVEYGWADGPSIIGH